MLGRSTRLSQDTSIGLLFVGMVSLGVVIVSRSQSFAVDLTALLLGYVPAVRERDLVHLAVALGIASTVSLVGHRSFVALVFDGRKARMLGLRPLLAHAVLLGLVTLAIVASFHVVGTLPVFGLLIAPPATALPWARRIPPIMLGAALWRPSHPTPEPILIRPPIPSRRAVGCRSRVTRVRGPGRGA